MAATITPLLTDWNLAEATTGWVVLGTGGTISLDGDSFIQGAGCVVNRITGAGTVGGMAYNNGSTVNLSNTHIYVWVSVLSQFATRVDTFANSGVAIRATGPTITNYVEWAVAGTDVWNGAWKCFVIDTSKTPTATGGTPPALTAIQHVGVVIKTTGTTKSGVNNLAVDAIRYGSGLKITGGSDATPGVWQDIVAADEGTTANRYGIVRKIEGNIFVQGELTFGDATSGETVFKDTNKAITFEDPRYYSGGSTSAVLSTLYRVLIQGNASNNTKVHWGAKSGSSGISGCTFRSAGAPKMRLVATSTNITELGIYGCSFTDCSTFDLPVNASGREVLNTAFNACGEVTASTCVMTNCTFVSSTNRALTIGSTSHNVTSCTFINCVRATRISATGTYTYNALKFAGSTTADVENSTAGAVTVNSTNGGDPTTTENSGGGSTTLRRPVTISITIKNAALSPIEGARVRVTATETVGTITSGDVLLIGATNASGVIENTDFNYETAFNPSGLDINILVRKATGSPFYQDGNQPGTIASTGFSLTMILGSDG